MLLRTFYYYVLQLSASTAVVRGITPLVQAKLVVLGQRYIPRTYSRQIFKGVDSKRILTADVAFNGAETHGNPQTGRILCKHTTYNLQR